MDDEGIPEFLRRPKDYVMPPWNPPVQTPEQQKTAFAKPVDKTKSLARPTVLGEIEGMMDDVLYAGHEPGSTYDMLTAHRATSTTARLVIEKYAPQLAELESLGPGCDPQLREGYSGWAREDLNRLVELVRSIIDGAERYVVNTRSSRRVAIRLPRAKSAQKQIAALKFARENPDLKLVSINPMRVVGAMAVWTYDVKRRLLTMYVSNSRSGFEVRGSSLRRLDAEASVCKVLRKPEKVLSDVLAGGKKAAMQVIVDVKTKSSTPSPRLNQNTIILRAEK